MCPKRQKELIGVKKQDLILKKGGFSVKYFSLFFTFLQSENESSLQKARY